MLEDMLSTFEVGALIIAAKTESVIEASEIARRAGREYIVIQPGGDIGLDLLTGSPDVDAMYFRDVFGRVPDDAKPYIDAAAMRMKYALQMLKSAGSQYYTFSHLANYIFDEQFNAQIRIFVQERARHMHRADDEALGDSRSGGLRGKTLSQLQRINAPRSVLLRLAIARAAAGRSARQDLRA